MIVLLHVITKHTDTLLLLNEMSRTIELRRGRIRSEDTGVWMVYLPFENAYVRIQVQGRDREGTFTMSGSVLVR